MKKILFVRSTPYDEDLQGYNVQGVGIAKAFCKLGYNCDYLNFNRMRNEIIVLLEENGVQARVIYKTRLRLFRTGICFQVLGKKFLSEYDIVICREYNQLMTHLIAKRHPNTSMYSGPYWNMFMIPFFSAIYDALYTQKMNSELKCKFVKSQLAKGFLEGKGYTKLIDIGVGLDITRFENVECMESTAELADYMRKNRCLLYVGKLDANKNIPFIIDMFGKVLEKEPDVKLVLIGRSKQTLQNKLLGKSDESFYEELIRTTPQQIRQNIKHINRIENQQLQFIYPIAKAFVLPSIYEIFGMVMLEAMYFGAPVITSRNGGSSTLIKDINYGQVIKGYDVEQWAKGISRYLNDSNYTDKVKENCKKLIREQYTWDKVCEKMLNFIDDQEEREC